MSNPIHEMRVDYCSGALHESDVDADPLRQFSHWFDDARKGGIMEPNAMSLATVGPDGWPHVRIVLLKGFDERGFTFFTNYDSVKARDMAADPRVALNLYWDRLERCVRITGTVTKTTRDESEAYFRSRPYRSQLGAWVSQQSSVVASRDVLEHRFADLDAMYKGGDVPCPPFWGGYRVAPATIEFWQGQPSRLHDRLRYTRRPDGTWKIERLNP